MGKQTFNKGDFIKYCSYSGNDSGVTFGIFEGVDLSPEYQYSKKYSLAAYYDSHKYCNNVDNGIGWAYMPFLDIARDDHQCYKTIDTLEEDTWWRKCTQLEKDRALEILADFGYEWNEDLMAIIDVETGEIIHRIIVPKIEYHGDSIKPIRKDFKEKLKQSVISKNKYTYDKYNYGGQHYGCYPYEGEYWY